MVHIESSGKNISLK